MTTCAAACTATAKGSTGSGAGQFLERTRTSRHSYIRIECYAGNLSNAVSSNLQSHGNLSLSAHRARSRMHDVYEQTLYSAMQAMIVAVGNHIPNASFTRRCRRVADKPRVVATTQCLTPCAYESNLNTCVYRTHLLNGRLIPAIT